VSFETRKTAAMRDLVAAEAGLKPPLWECTISFLLDLVN
jgi:hypothetical protein